MTEPQDRTILCEISIDSDGDLSDFRFVHPCDMPNAEVACVLMQLAEAFIRAGEKAYTESMN